MRINTKYCNQVLDGFRYDGREEINLSLVLFLICNLVVVPMILIFGLSGSIALFLLEFIQLKSKNPKVASQVMADHRRKWKKREIAQVSVRQHPDAIRIYDAQGELTNLIDQPLNQTDGYR